MDAMNGSSRTIYSTDFTNLRNLLAIAYTY